MTLVLLENNSKQLSAFEYVVCLKCMKIIKQDRQAIYDDKHPNFEIHATVVENPMNP